MSMIPTATPFNHILAFEVSKSELVLHVLPADSCERLTNTPAAVRRALKRERSRNLKQGLGKLLVVCEATGGYERHILDQAAALELPTHRAHGSRTRLFALFQGHRAKTDDIDARLLARYAQSTPDLLLYRPAGPELEALRALRRRRDDLIEMQRMELNRMEHVRHTGVRTSIEQHLAMLGAQIKALEAEIAALIDNTEALRRKASLMNSVKGVGPSTITACLAYLPELGTLSKARVAAIAGLAPHANDSGQHKGARHIGGGRTSIRAPLYMAALVATRFNPAIKRFAQALKARGKPQKLILTAVMRKLIVILNAVLKSGKPAYP
jgi:transposase